LQRINRETPGTSKDSKNLPEFHQQELATLVVWQIAKQTLTNRASSNIRIFLAETPINQAERMF